MVQPNLCKNSNYLLLATWFIDNPQVTIKTKLRLPLCGCEYASSIHHSCWKLCHSKDTGKDAHLKTRNTSECINMASVYEGFTARLFVKLRYFFLALSSHSVQTREDLIIRKITNKGPPEQDTGLGQNIPICCLIFF